MTAGVIEADILQGDGLLRGQMRWQEGRISHLEGRMVSWEERADVLLPGFIDLHVHGGGGCDCMEGGAALATIAGAHARHGTTALLATTVCAPQDELGQALAGMSQFFQHRAAKAARVLGVHLEGPYINPEQLGAQPAFARLPSVAEVRALHGVLPIRLITLAPEHGVDAAFMAALKGLGIKVQIGHSRATYEEVVAALGMGAHGFTHLFNAMSGLHHRAPGVVGAALAHADYAEIIPDLVHVHPGAIRVALRAIEGLYCVTDATAAAAMPEGQYTLGRHTVYACQNGVRLADGTLAGSNLTMDQALRNLLALGLSLGEASRRLSTIAARYLGLADRGVLQPGAYADAVLLDGQSLAVKQVWVEGEAVL